MAALRQVQNKHLSLNADINTALIAWKVPNSPAANGKVVTLRELLTHTAGLTVHGFPGYAANEPVPTLIQVLDGQRPANTPAIRLQSEPGSTWKYSGGGYTVMQPTFVSMDALKQEVCFAFRQILRSPAFALIAVFTLALGIGENAAIFSLVDAIISGYLKAVSYRQLTA
jgi:hypothetical protein